MKQILFLILATFSSGKFCAQTERYIYDSRVNPDTVNLVKMRNERTFLDVKNDHSTFVSENRLLKDSLISIFKKQQANDSQFAKKNKKGKLDFPKLADGKSLQPTFFDFFIQKKPVAGEVSLVENAGNKEIFYEEDRKMIWKISDEKMDLNGDKVQKATTDFGGRIWTAWFSENIKISDGPYKFYGLPGLILKLEDASGDYGFTFLKKIIVPDAYLEIISPEAKKTTRINFIGEKASAELEMYQKNPNKSGDYNMVDSGKRKGRRQNNMNSGMDADDANTGGLSQMEDYEDDNDSDAPNMNKGQFGGFNGRRHTFNNNSQTDETGINLQLYRNISRSNPIELK
ncbi:GLPGLI family protein [Halpernia frigidisoli]|uniref:GLPGLI family protein n=1 Tax=Halpernia frigidisoli TaxID=1125876 RepID=A0A1I3GWX5_9FLAO|nr:GLPGLI family protein [Halpernia frigidisoli]SFI27820.1 GLPGLI family protein [Halpernia frigidisoli]